MKKNYLFSLINITLITILFQSCAKFPSDVIMPQWDVDLNVPLATKSYLLADIIKPQNYISIDPTHDSLYVITSDTYSQSVGISNFIKVLTSSEVAGIPIFAGVIDFAVSVPFPGGAKINTAEFQSGTLFIAGHNPKSTPVNLIISIPCIFNADGTGSLKDTLIVPAQNGANPGYASLLIDLAGRSYIASDQNNQNSLYIHLSLTGTLDITYPYVTFDSKVSDFDFTSFTGYLPTKSLGTKTNSFSLNLGDAVKYRDKVTLSTASLIMNGKYKSSASDPFIVEVDNFQVVGSRIGSTLTQALTFYSGSNTFRFDATGNFTAVYDTTNSNITTFIDFLPDVINISAKYVMNPDNSQEFKTATSKDTINFTTNFSTKSVLAVKQTSFSDTLALNISQDNRDKIVKGKGVSATVDIQNAIPLNSWIRVTLADSSYHTLFVISKSASGADSISFPGATVDGNGNVVTLGANSTTISLDSAQIKQLAQKAYYAIISVTVITTGNNNTPITVKAKDWIKLNVYGSVTYRINEKD
jgi:hypothetical protein